MRSERPMATEMVMSVACVQSDNVQAINGRERRSVPSMAFSYTNIEY